MVHSSVFDSHGLLEAFSPRKKLQMTTQNVVRISETLGANLGVLIIAGGEPFTRKDLPEIARAFYENNRLESIYLMSNGQIQQRIIPDVSARQKDLAHQYIDPASRISFQVSGIHGLQELWIEEAELPDPTSVRGM